MTNARPGPAPVEDEASRILEELQSAHPDVREMAIHKAALAQLKEAVPLLLKLSQEEPRPDVRYFARKVRDIIERASTVSASPEFSDDPVALARSLTSPDYNVRTRAVQALGRTGPEALGPLTQIVGSERHPYVRSALVKALGQVAGRENKLVVQLVVKMFLTDTDARVRANAVEALGLMQAQSAAAVLVMLVKDEDHRVSSNAALVLSAWEPEVVLHTAQRMIETRKPRMVDAAAYMLTQAPALAHLPLYRQVLAGPCDSAKYRVLQAAKGLAEQGHAEAQSLLSDHGLAAASPPRVTSGAIPALPPPPPAPSAQPTALRSAPPSLVVAVVGVGLVSVFALGRATGVANVIDGLARSSYEAPGVAVSQPPQPPQAPQTPRPPEPPLATAPLLPRPAPGAVAPPVPSAPAPVRAAPSVDAAASVSVAASPAPLGPCLTGDEDASVLLENGLASYLEFRVEPGRPYKLALTDRCRVAARWEEGNGTVDLVPLQAGDGAVPLERLAACPEGGLLVRDLEIPEGGLMLSTADGSATSVRLYLVR